VISQFKPTSVAFESLTEIYQELFAGHLFQSERWLNHGHTWLKTLFKFAQTPNFLPSAFSRLVQIALSPFAFATHIESAQLYGDLILRSIFAAILR